MDNDLFKIIVGAAIALLGTGSIIGYWLKGKVDDRRAEKNFKRKFYLEDLQKQRNLLLDFLGQPKSEFTMLHGVGQTWDQDWRRDKARTVSDWVERYRPHFPEHVQKALTGLANLAGTMVVVEGYKFAHRIEGIDATFKWVETVKAYLHEITTELKGKDRTA
jgi:hypothetical protein